MEKQERVKLPYEPPEIVTYSGDEIIDDIVFAQGCSPSPCPAPSFF